MVFVVNVSFSQQKPKTEPTEMSIPYDVAQKMLLDLNDYDRLKELSKLDKEEIKQLNNKILFLEKILCLLVLQVLVLAHLSFLKNILHDEHNHILNN